MLSNPKYQSTAEEDEFVTSITEDTIIDDDKFIPGEYDE